MNNFPTPDREILVVVGQWVMIEDFRYTPPYIGQVLDIKPSVSYEGMMYKVSHPEWGTNWVTDHKMTALPITHWYEAPQRLPDDLARDIEALLKTMYENAEANGKDFLIPFLNATTMFDKTEKKED